VIATTPLPENLERVAEAGGWDARAMEQAKEFMKEAGKIKPDQWKGINENLKMVKEFVDISLNSFASQMVDNITTSIKLEVESIIAPLSDTIITSMNDLINPLINQYLMPIVQDLQGFLKDNSEGAGIGGIAGSVTSMFLPGGQIWVVIGALIGAGIQTLIDLLFPGGGKEYFDEHMAGYGAWLEWNPGGTITQYLTWYNKTHTTGNTYALPPSQRGFIE